MPLTEQTPRALSATGPPDGRRGGVSPQGARVAGSRPGWRDIGESRYRSARTASGSGKVEARLLMPQADRLRPARQRTAASLGDRISDLPSSIRRLQRADPARAGHEGARGELRSLDGFRHPQSIRSMPSMALRGDRGTVPTEEARQGLRLLPRGRFTAAVIAREG